MVFRNEFRPLSPDIEIDEGRTIVIQGRNSCKGEEHWDIGNSTAVPPLASSAFAG